MSVTSAGPGSRIGRNYTRARTHPWVLGKLGDFVLWFGPYNTSQLVIAAVGVLVLIKTFDWWSGLGPVPVLALGALVWAARAQRVGGRVPVWVLYGLTRRALQPKAGRIGGRGARPPRTHHLTGSVLIEHTTEPTEPTELVGPADPAECTGPARPSARAGSPAGCGGAPQSCHALGAARPPRGPRPARADPATPQPAPTPAPVPVRAPARAGGGGGPVPTPLQQMLHDRSMTKAAAR